MVLFLGAAVGHARPEGIKLSVFDLFVDYIILYYIMGNRII